MFSRDSPVLQLSLYVNQNIWKNEIKWLNYLYFMDINPRGFNSVPIVCHTKVIITESLLY